MFQYVFLAPLSILVNGFFLRKVSGRFFSLRNDIRSIFNESLLIGTCALIFPMVIIGILLDGLLYVSAYGYFAISMALLAFYFAKTILRLPNFLLSAEEFVDKAQKEIVQFGAERENEDRITRLNRFFMENVSFHRILISVNYLILAQYALLAILSPPTGWDALHVYLPNSLYYYLTDEIPSTINPLNFIYTFKPPVNSLLITYTYYISKGFHPHLIPVLYLAGLSALTYDLSREIGLGKIVAAMASILLLISPFMYYMMHEFIFYQDLPVAYFISMGFLYYLRAMKEENGLKNNGLFLAMAFGISPLTKISGYSFPLLLLMSFPLLKGRKDLLLKLMVLVSISVLLFRKSSTNVYVGVGIAVVVIFVIVFILTLGNYSKSNVISIKPFAVSLSLASISGLLWLYHMIRNEITREFLYDVYLATPPRPIRTAFPSVPPELAYFEHGHTVNLFTTIFVIFLGSPFNLFLLPFKLVGMINTFFERNSQGGMFLLTWLFTFYGFWLGYFSQASIRYLSVIMVPLSILTAAGFFSFLQFLSSISPTLFFKNVYNSIRHELDSNVNTEIVERANVFDLFRFDHRFGLFEQAVILVLIGTNYLFYYPFIPFHAVFHSPNFRWYEYHKSIWPLLTYLAGFILLLWLSISFYSRFRFLLARRSVPLTIHVQHTNLERRFFTKVAPIRRKIGRGTKLGLLLLIVISPSLVQVGYLASHNFDVEAYQEFFYYDNRPQFKELVDFINSIGLDPTYIMIGVNIPGIEFFTQRSFIDLWFAGMANVSTSFRSSNITEALQVLSDNNVHFIIGLNTEHAYFNEYIKSFVPRYPFLVEVEDLYRPVFQNGEFKVFIF